MKARLRVMSVVVAAVLAAAGCGDDDGSGGNDTSIAPVSLAADTVVTAAASPSTEAAEGPRADAPDVTILESDPDVASESSVTIAAGPEAPDPDRASGVEGVLTLRPQGLGAFNFGAPADEVIASVTAKLGPPTSDSGWHKQESPCDDMGEMERTVIFGWLVLLFSNGPDQYGPSGDEHFASYAIFDPADGTPDPKLPTDDGLPILGVDLAALKTRFPGTEASTNTIQGAVFERPDGLGGELSQTSDRGVVTGVRAGNVCID